MYSSFLLIIFSFQTDKYSLHCEHPPPTTKENTHSWNLKKKQIGYELLTVVLHQKLVGLRAQIQCITYDAKCGQAFPCKTTN